MNNKKFNSYYLISYIGIIIAIILVMYSILNIGGVDGQQSTYGTVQVIEKTSNNDESSYQVGVALSATDFSSIGKRLSDAIAQEWSEYDGMSEIQRITSSKLWGCVAIQTDTWSECEEAIGFTLKNPLESLDWLNKTGCFGMESTDPDTPVKHVQVAADTSGNQDRKPDEISVLAGYCIEDIRITLSATMSSNNGTYTMGSVCDGYATYKEENTTTGSGIPVLIVTTNESNNNGYYDGDYFDPTAYWVEDNVFYTLRVVGDERDNRFLEIP